MGAPSEKASLIGTVVTLSVWSLIEVLFHRAGCFGGEGVLMVLHAPAKNVEVEGGPREDAQRVFIPRLRFLLAVECGNVV